MKDDFNYSFTNLIVIKNNKTNQIKTFKSRNDFVKFLEKNVRLDEKNLIQFEKDIKILMKEILLYKYLPDWHVVED